MVGFAPRNRQYSNVANLGDVLKHGVLVRLLGVLSSGSGRVTYVDPYAFIPTWPCPNNQRWMNEADAIASRAKGFVEYQKLEHEELRSGRPYLCSVGIVRKMLGDSRVRLLVAEQQDFERAVLTRELGPTVVVEPGARELADRLGDLLAAEEHVVALIDPFKFDSGATAVLHCFLKAVGKATWAAVLFDYSDTGKSPGFVKSLRACDLWLLSRGRKKAIGQQSKTVKFHVGLAGNLSGLAEVAADCGMKRR